MTEQMELNAIWLSKPIPVIRKRGFEKRTSRILEGDVICIDENNQPSSKGDLHKVLCCLGTLFSTHLELMVTSVKTSEVKLIKIG